MDSIGIDGNHNNNEMEDEFDELCVYETLISEGFINGDLYDTDDDQRSIHSYVSLKDEDISDRAGLDFIIQIACDTEFTQETIDNDINLKDENIDNLAIVIPATEEVLTDSKDGKACLDESAINEEACSITDELESLQDYLNQLDDNIDDLALLAQEMLPTTDGIDDKECTYETIINEGYLNEDACDTETKSESVHNIDLKGCKECGEEYDLYCIKCSMLTRIFDGNNPDGKDNTLGWTLPKKIIDICETPTGVAIVALKTIPKGVIFGPFKGLVSTKGDTVSKWKLRNQKLVCTKDPRWLNWMQYIRIADEDSQQNLVPFQYKGGLYYRSECDINEGDEVLVSCDSYSMESEIEDMEDSYWEPPVCESLDDSYACTYCCVGYKTIGHLKTHNSTCIEKRNKKGFCADIAQCSICKIYLDKKEYSDYHMNRCYKNNKECVLKSRCKKNRPPQYDVRYGDRSFSCTLCAYKTKRKWKLRRHIGTHYGDKPFACTFCPYKGMTSSKLKRHLATHNDDRPYACTFCPYKTLYNSTLKRHIAIHSDDRPIVCSLCPYKTNEPSSLKRHIANHNDDRPYACTLCPYKAKKTSNLKRHMGSHNDDRPYACSICSYKAKTNFSLKRHIAHHKGDKPFACTLCPYKAKMAANLKQHIAIHNDDRPFACTLCSYKAKTSLTLKRHLSIHNGDRPFACTLCPYKANKASTLKRHVASHNGEKPFACPLCPYKVTTQSILKRHLVSHDE